MSSRNIPYDKNERCNICGMEGTFDFMGDSVCINCYNNICYSNSKSKKKNRKRGKMKLFKITLKNYHIYFTVAQSPDEAYNKVRKFLDGIDRYFMVDRKLIKVEVMAEEREDLVV